ncbi:retrovirus-related pol polyprotein from transposon TNT 1-94 [Tanacetum coccineum]
MTTSNSSVNVSQPQIPVFKRDSYEFWSIKMKTLFRSQDLWDLVDKGCADSTSEETTNKENQKRDAKALFFIQQAVDETIFSTTVAANSAKEAWDTLKIEYQSCSKPYRNRKILPTYSVELAQGSMQNSKARINRNVVKKEHAFQVQGKQAKFSYNRSRGRGQLMDRGFDVFFNSKNKTCTVIKDGEVMVKSSMTENRMFPVDFSCDNIYGLISSKEESTDVVRTPYFVNKRSNRVCPVIKEREHTCEGFALGKQARKTFDVAQAKRAEEKTRIEHADKICGPMKTDSYAGSKYFLLFIDDYSRMCWVYFLTYKSEAFGFFKKFKALAENQSNRKLMVLRTNRGGEFLSKEFNGFSNEHGIKRELTAPYTPEQNGIAERKNRTIVEMARCMLKAKNLEDAFWAETVEHILWQNHILPQKPCMEMSRLLMHDKNLNKARQSAIGKEVWKKVMQEEINSIEKNGTWKLVNLPEGKKAIGLKWIFKTKLHSDGTIQRHKARLVARGYVQEQVGFRYLLLHIVAMLSNRLSNSHSIQIMLLNIPGNL